MTSDRRHHPRVQIRRTLFGRIEQSHVELVTSDISIGGAFVRTDRTWPPGTHMELSIDRGEGPRSTSATVVHQHERGMGLAFLVQDTEFLHDVAQIIGEELAHGAPYICRRSGQRVPGRIALLVREDMQYRPFFTRNVSETGALLALGDETVEPDDVRLTLSEHGVFDCEARVAWRTTATIGVHFQNGPPQFYNAMSRILDAFLGLNK